MTRITKPLLRTDMLLLVVLCGFLFFYGLSAFGLIGADEPRYAQVAREMLERSDWVTPTLHGKPWLEKPVFYYWQAMMLFRIAGVSDFVARLPSAIDAVLLVVAVYCFLARFRRGSQLDGALITASCAGVIGFARAAATDMPLCASFSIAMICWYAWYQSEERRYLSGFYMALAVATLAKGPVAPVLCATILFLFLAVRRDWPALYRTLWIPGICLYFAVALPWYITVQLRNPEFFRFFILEHNLARFSTNVYHHPQPFWFYMPVFLLAMMPWTIILLAAIAERGHGAWSEGRNAFFRAEESWSLFLLVWIVVPIIFFSVSRSKLPGYILPAVPAGALLIADYLAERRRKERKFSLFFVAAQGLLCGLLIFMSLSAASVSINHRLLWARGTYIAAAASVVVALGISLTLLSRVGLKLLRPVTLFVVVVSVAVILRFAAPVLDATQSARGVAQSIQAFSKESSKDQTPIAFYKVNRLMEYGIDFYLNYEAQKYEDGNIPAAAHVVVAAQGSQAKVAQLAAGRRVSYLTSIPAQRLDLYWVKK